MRFDDLCYTVVARAYKKDQLTAGIVIAHLPDCYYAAIVRYPDGHDGEKVVEAHGYSRFDSRHALAMLMISWSHKSKLTLAKRFIRIARTYLDAAQRRADE
jgi:hypothetical protein